MINGIEIYGHVSPTIHSFINIEEAEKWFNSCIEFEKETIFKHGIAIFDKTHIIKRNVKFDKIMGVVRNG